VLFAYARSRLSGMLTLNGLGHEMLDRCQQVLTEKEFIIMFEIAPGTRMNLVESEIASTKFK
jgi:hypothetical protein